MSVIYKPHEVLYAIVEYLKSSDHIYDPVDGKPEKDGQYRLVCLAVNAEDARKVTHLLRALSNGTHWYSVCIAEPEVTCSHNQADCEECVVGIFREKCLKPDLHN